MFDPYLILEKYETGPGFSVDILIRISDRKKLENLFPKEKPAYKFELKCC